ncbi:hypothetical protein HanPI659440_Chr03g0097781 [Helianthus annuus]|nr:hypothetical protein HanPI659440_Chr03g0097781 [Helianthus annuus]
MTPFKSLSPPKRDSLFFSSDKKHLSTFLFLYLKNYSIKLRDLLIKLKTSIILHHKQRNKAHSCFLVHPQKRKLLFLLCFHRTKQQEQFFLFFFL